MTNAAISSRPAAARLNLVALPLLCFGALFFVGTNCLWAYSTPSRSLDGSWAYVLHELAGKAHFGSELVFTYGPLGFLIAHGDTPSTYLWRLCFHSLLLLWLYGQMSLLAFRGPDTSSPLTLQKALLFIVAGPIAVSFSYFGRDLFPDGAPILAVALGAINIIRLSAPQDRTIRIAIACSLAVLALVKGTLISIIGLFMILLVLRRLVLRQGSWDVPVAALLCFLGLWLATGNLIVDIPRFLWATKEIAGGFTTAMQTEGALHRQTRCAFLALSALIALRYGIAAGPRKTDRFIIGVVMIAMGFMLTKHATDRFDEHVFGPTFAMFALSFVTLTMSHRSWRSIALSLCAIALCSVTLNYALKSQKPALSPQDRRAWIVKGGDFYPHLEGQWLQILSLRDKLDQERAHFSAVTAVLGVGLPDVTASQTVDIYSFKQGAVFARNFSYKPRPVFQSYSAYTPWLAMMNRDFVRSPDAPDRIFFAIDPIDQRLASMEDGLSWFELISRYRLNGIFTFAGIQHLDLEKLPKPTSFGYGAEQTYSLDLNAWQPVSTSNLIWLRGNPSRRSVPKSILAQLYKSPIYWLEIELNDGRTVRRRLIEPMIETGFLINPVVDSTQDYLEMLSPPSGDRKHQKQVRQYRIVCGTNDACPISQWAVKSAPVEIAPDPSWLHPSQKHDDTSIIDLWIRGVMTEPTNARRAEEGGHAVLQASPTTVSLLQASKLGLENAVLIRTCFGIMRLAYEKGNTDGVEFEIQVGTNDEWRHPVWARHLNPKNNLADQGEQCAEVSLPGNQKELAFITKPGKSADWDFSYWRSLQRLK